MSQLRLGNIVVEVVLKDIKNVHLSVYPPNGRVKIAAPQRMNLDTIRLYAISKLGWIKKQQTKIKAQPREAKRDFVTRESHFYQGKRYLLKVIEQDAPPKVVLKHSTIELYVRPKTNRAKRKSIMDEWYRERLKEAIPPYIAKWEKEMMLRVNEFAVKKMKTKWGTCMAEAGRIWLNLELAKKPPQCLEYIIAHEMVHLLERHHNDRFIALMDRYMPQWRSHKEVLNRLPVSHVEWGY